MCQPGQWLPGHHNQYYHHHHKTNTLPIYQVRPQILILFDFSEFETRISDPHHHPSSASKLPVNPGFLHGAGLSLSVGCDPFSDKDHKAVKIGSEDWVVEKTCHTIGLNVMEGCTISVSSWQVEMCSGHLESDQHYCCTTNSWTKLWHECPANGRSKQTSWRIGSYRRYILIFTDVIYWIGSHRRYILTPFEDPQAVLWHLLQKYTMNK